MQGFIRTCSLVVALSGAAVAQAADITGAGATFPYPIYSKWAEIYKAKTGAGLNYQSIGSGGGIKQIKARTVDFGASDMPLKAEDLEKDPESVTRTAQSLDWHGFRAFFRSPAG
ncbi:substrate-binding domain-containing protein [Zoogloea oleivorans]|uniref:substrate-binding domain-containing protein n=1 Tax=Zoogloea oleivorans TaxID=1552750 RepID=UPI001CA34AB5|nr:substrate-binding domain-containing protein [Zoogloea oleivorans]